MCIQGRRTHFAHPLPPRPLHFNCLNFAFLQLTIFFVPRLNEVEEGGYLNYPSFVRPSGDPCACLHDNLKTLLWRLTIHLIWVLLFII